MTVSLPPDNLDLAACLEAARHAGVSGGNRDRLRLRFSRAKASAPEQAICCFGMIASLSPSN
jgi:hypothetical protein